MGEARSQIGYFPRHRGSSSTEFTQYEIHAAFALTKRKRDCRKRVTLGQVIEMNPEMGGFADKQSEASQGRRSSDGASIASRSSLLDSRKG